MEDISWRWKPILLLISALLEFSYGFPINLDSNLTENHAQFLTSLLAVLLATCGVFILVGCLCCQRRNGFKEFHDSPIAVTDIQETGHVNPVANSEFTIFKPLTSLSLSNSIFRSDEKLHFSVWFSEEPFSRAKLQYVKELGKGWFGRVVEGTITDQSTSVAVRILESCATSKERAAFLQDALIYRLSDHPNVLKFIGCSLENVPLLIVQEYCPLGDLKGFLHERIGSLSTDWLLDCCVQITAALKYIHELKLLHSDLAARSCLVCNDLSIKLGDYGLQAVLYPEDYYQGVLGVPLRWCAPETVVYTATTIETKAVTYESNVWSLGVTLWEICEAGKQPYEGLTDDDVLAHVLGESRSRLEKPQLMKALYTDYLYEIMVQCWADVDIRPTVCRIDAMLTDLNRVFHKNSFETRWNEAPAKSVREQTNERKVQTETSNESAVEYSDPTVEELQNDCDVTDIKFDQRWNEAKTNNKILLSDSLTNLAAFELDSDPLWTLTDTLLREKSRSVTDLMVLTHIECSESDSETPLASLEWKKRCFGSDGDVTAVETSAFREELSKMQNERKNIISTNVPETYRGVPKLSEIIENNVELVDYIIAKHETVFESMKMYDDDEDDLKLPGVTNNNTDIKACDSMQCKFKLNKTLEETDKFIELEKLYYDCCDAVLPQSGVILGPCDSYSMDFYKGLKTTSEHYDKVPEFRPEMLANAESHLKVDINARSTEDESHKLAESLLTENLNSTFTAVEKVASCVANSDDGRSSVELVELEKANDRSCEADAELAEQKITELSSSDIDCKEDCLLTFKNTLETDLLDDEKQRREENLDSIEQDLIRELEQESAATDEVPLDDTTSRDDEEELNKTYNITSEDDNSANDPLNTTFTISESTDLNDTFVFQPDDNKEKNWSENGWYLHLQTDAPLPDGNICSPSSSSLMNEEEIMTAIRNELLSKLPNASGGNNSQSFQEEPQEDLLLDWGTEDNRERDEMLVRYRTYLSPIPEENEVSETNESNAAERFKDKRETDDCADEEDTSSSTSSDETNCDDLDSNSDGDSDSDWSLKDSNDTLFNVQDLKCEQKPSSNGGVSSTNIPPLPSPEDIPWRQLPASLLSYEQVTVTDGAPDAVDCADPGGFLSDLRFLGPTVAANAAHQMSNNCCEMSTSFSESVEGNDDEEDEEDNGEDWESDTRSSSSGEFIWREGEHEESLRALPPSTNAEDDERKAVEDSKRHRNRHREGQMHLDEVEEDEDESDDGSSSFDEMELHEFVPSAWDMNATPTKSSLRSPSKQNSNRNAAENTDKVTCKKPGQVWFKKQKYHCVYEYPRESQEEEESPYNDKSHYFVHPTVNDLRLDTNTDWTLFNQQLALASSIGRDEDFFISSTARPFQQHQHSSAADEPAATAAAAAAFMSTSGSSAEFFPGQHYNQHLQLWTPDSGVDSEDAAPAYGYAFADDLQKTPRGDHGGANEETVTEGVKTQATKVERLQTLAANVLAANKTAAVAAAATVDCSANSRRKESLGQLRHTRDKLKLDLLSTAGKSDRSSSSSSSTSSMDWKLDSCPNYSDSQPLDPELITNRLSNEGGDSPVLSRRSPPTFSTFGKKSSRFQVSHVWTPPEEEGPPLVGSKVKDVSFQALPHVRGEASLLDSADEDSGIESSTLERLRLL